MSTLLIVTNGGALSRKSRLLIERAPTNLVVKVERASEKLRGSSLNLIVMDEMQ